MTTTITNTGSHHQTIDTIRTKPFRILMVVANPSVSTTTGWPVGFWAAELTHPYYEFTEAGHEVTIASPNGGEVKVDSLSDPRDASKWSAEDLISYGFLSSPDHTALLENTPKLADLNWEEYDALVIAGGQSPMFTFRDNEDLKRAIRTFYEAEKPVAAYCHGVAALMDVTLSDGSYLVEGKTVTGFANVEEDFSNQAAGTKIMPWRVEDTFRERGANYVQAGIFKPFAIRDGRLFTGQQQYSGRKVAQMLIAALGQ